MREEAQVKRHSQANEFRTQNYLDLDKLTLLDPTQSQNTQVLQPIPAQQTSLKMSSFDNMLTKNINLSDFESDTSSPFDNMELKTINDLEELASVLKPTSVLNNTSVKNCQSSNLFVTQNYTTPVYNNYTENYKSNEFIHNASTQCNQPVITTPTLKSNVIENKNKSVLPPVTMPNVLLQLKADLNTLKYNDDLIVSTWYKITLFSKINVFMFFLKNDPKSLPSNLTTNGSKSPTCSFSNPYRSLSPISQYLADQMHEMGFPLARAARACKIFGKDESKVRDKLINDVLKVCKTIYCNFKVIEFLIQIRSIEETSGYSANRIEQALVVNNFNADHAIKFLKNVDRLIDFGFREENICSALVKCNNDPDKALDSLVSY